MLEYRVLLTYWLLLGAIATGGAAYAAVYWWQSSRLRGIRGAALVITLLCFSVIAFCFVGLHSHQTRLPVSWLLVIERSVWWPFLFSLLVLVDLYAADSNGHRALSTILYLRWERMRARRG